MLMAGIFCVVLAAMVTQLLQWSLTRFPSRNRMICRYETPLSSEIDKVGITPDDSCQLGPEVPAGVPFDPETALRVSQALTGDGCVLRAENRLEAMLQRSEKLVWHPTSNTWSP